MLVTGTGTQHRYQIDTEQLISIFFLPKAKVWSVLSTANAETIIHAFVHLPLGL